MSEIKCYGEGTETKARGTDTERDDNDNSDSAQQLRCPSQSSEPGEQVGVDNKNRTRRDTALRWSIAGGILDQLIADAEDQLAKTRACIDWYQQEELEKVARLENLKRLRDLARRQESVE